MAHASMHGCKVYIVYSLPDACMHLPELLLRESCLDLFEGAIEEAVPEGYHDDVEPLSRQLHSDGFTDACGELLR